MDNETLGKDSGFHKIIAFILTHRLPLLLVFSGLSFLILGLLIESWQQSKAPVVITEQSDEQSAKTAVGREGNEILVDVSGAVLRPNVYSLRKNERIVDALAAAGGLSAEANREWVSKNLNLAAKLSDGAKIYIPGSEEGNGGAGSSSQGQKINLNSAGISELDSLPGIGEATAKKIVAGRPYTSIDDLKTKKVVSFSVFEKIKELITIY